MHREQHPPRVRTYRNLGIMLGTVNSAGLASLRADPNAAKVLSAPEFSLVRPVLTAQAKPTKDVTWGVDRLRVPELWDAGLSGKGVLVGHLDTGVDGSHPALKGAIAQFAEFDALGQPVANAKPHDTAQHGTHTAGTVAGRAVGKTSFGVAPGARLASAIVIEGGQVIARVLAGMDWVVGMKARILSMSLGLRGYVDDFLPVVQILRAKGVLPVFAVGNEGPGTSRSPGNYAEALSVGSVDKDDTVSDFSSSQRLARPVDPLVPDLVAPGRDVISCVPGGQYMMMSGTSMATPHISGLAALLMEAKPGASIDDVEKAIFGSCIRPAAMLDERGNRGIPDAVNAYTLLTGSVPKSGSLAGLARAKTPKSPVKKKVVAPKAKARAKPKASPQPGKRGNG